MDRYGHTTRSGKRPAEPEWEQHEEEEEEEGRTASSAAKKPRVPALASVIVEALKLDSLQKLCSGLEPLLRRIVSEEVERALTRLDCAKLSGSKSSPQRIEVPGGRKLQLQFRSRLPPHLFTGGKVEGEKGTSIHVVLLDANTGMVVSSGPESMAKLHVVVLEGDFSDESDDNWTEEYFENYEVKEREGKRPLLTGDLQVILKEGVGTLGDLTFTDNSSWIRSRKFRLGVKLADGFCDGLRIREAKTDAFAVKDHRGELYKKHYPPALHDEVWRLDRIAKDGALHKKLVNSRISTVEEFLRLLVRDPQKLRSILGSGMSNKMWDNTVEHAKTCVLGGKLYIYYADQSQTTGAVFNDIYELRGLISAGQFLSVEALVHNQKVLVDILVKRAYDDWNHVVEYDGKALMNSLNNSQKAQSLLPVTDEDAQTDQYFMPARQTQSFCSSEVGTHAQTERTYKPYSPPELALATPQAYPSIYPSGDWPNTRDELGSMDYFSEEEIRTRSSEILEHDDMQQLLRSFPTSSPYYGYHSGHLEPHGQCEFGQGRNPHNAKASVSWLKLKAAFRWGIFVRKKSAQRRAQLVELD